MCVRVRGTSLGSAVSVSIRIVATVSEVVVVVLVVVYSGDVVSRSMCLCWARSGSTDSCDVL